MAKAQLSKLEKAKQQVVVQKTSSQTISNNGYYDEKDVLKHFIRKFFWKKRIENYKSDRKEIIQNGVKYFTFCSKYAYDVRYFDKEGLLNQNTPFAFIEFMQEDYDFLINQFVGKRYSNRATGFYGSLADVATTTTHKEYGSFWGSFPYDVINLDYLGDIFKSNAPDGLIGKNDFYAIQAIISNQSLLRKPYELWITVRAKSGRFDPSIKQEFRNIIEHNIQEHFKFKQAFEERFGNEETINTLPDDNLFLIGYLKWLWFICKNSFSTINSKKIEIIKYGRIDKNKEPYELYNIFLRIEPYDDPTSIPSPAGSAAKYCLAEYVNGIQSCFATPTDIDKEYAKLNESEKKLLKEELKTLHIQYQDDANGYI